MAVIAAPGTVSPQRSAHYLALTALTPLVWGSTYAVTTEFLPPERPLFTALMRALPAGLVLLAVTRVLPRGAWIWRATVLGALNIGAFFPLLFLAAYRLPGGVAAVLGAVGPLFALAFAAALLAERPTSRKLLAGFAGLLGVGLVVLRADAGLDTVGVLAGLAGAASMTAGTVLTKRWGRPEGVGALTLTGWQLTAGGLLLVPVALLVEGPPPALNGENLLGYIYLGVIGTAIAYWLWFRGISRLPATSVAFLGLLSPVSAAIIGWAVLRQDLTPVQLLGMVIALGGTLLGQTQARPRHRSHGEAGRAHTVPAHGIPDRGTPDLGPRTCPMPTATR
ncbi:EamA family transporter [Actinomadura alba]|uniref:EamA family transporter n=1 Tax=Actinomadura alba TaxID=406431 RepID=A0ABR7M253_9ACTN|nr:EamA family transporter [Actinomadura alba]MBC6471199.1 EamA family transporter [Actinomadura alba]